MRSLMTHDPSSISKNWASNSDTASHRTNPQLVCFFPARTFEIVQPGWRRLTFDPSESAVKNDSLEEFPFKYCMGNSDSCKFLRCSFLVWTTICYDVKITKCHRWTNLGTTQYTSHIQSLRKISLWPSSLKSLKEKKHMFFRRFSGWKNRAQLSTGAKARVWRVWWMQRRWRLRKARQPPDSALVLASGPSSTWNDPRSSMRTWKRVKVNVCLLGEAEKLKDTPRNPPYGNWEGAAE